MLFSDYGIGKKKAWNRCSTAWITYISAELMYSKFIFFCAQLHTHRGNRFSAPERPISALPGPLRSAATRRRAGCCLARSLAFIQIALLTNRQFARISRCCDRVRGDCLGPSIHDARSLPPCSLQVRRPQLIPTPYEFTRRLMLMWSCPTLFKEKK